MQPFLVNPALIDLHTHSTASDGTLNPSELVEEASRAGISTLSLTDHDTIEGLPEASRIAIRLGVKFISGIELSVDYEDGSLHLLGYGFDPGDEALETTLREVEISRQDRNIRMVERLGQLGYSISMSDLHTLSPVGVLGRVHMGQWLVQTGQMTSMGEAFEKLLGRGRAAYSDRERLTLSDACSLIHQAGGATVWAHPGVHGTKVELLLTRVPKWHAEGLDGLESHYAAHSLILRDRLIQLAVTNKMIYTGGSDFHGGARPEVHLGDGPGGSNINDEIVDSLMNRISAYAKPFAGNRAL